RPARIDDYFELEGVMGQVLQVLETGIRAGVGVPVLVDGRLWGVMMVQSREPAPLAEGTEQRLTAFTELLAAAISNAQARDDLRRLRDEQAALRRVATLVAEGAEPSAVFDAVCSETGRLLGAASTNLAEFTADGCVLTVAGWSAHDTHVPTGTRVSIEPN